MSANFLDLPRELRDLVYELCLLHPVPIVPWFQQELTSGLLRANKTAHREASPLFYSQNRFDFTWTGPEEIASFLRTIGRNNDYIQHVCVDFPHFHYREPGDVTLSDGGISIFESIQSSCANLSTLTAFAYSTYSMELRLEEPDNPEIVTEVLMLVDTRFRAISSLKKIIVCVYDDDPSSSFIREMKNRGWTINETEYGEEWDTDRYDDHLGDNDYD